MTAPIWKHKIREEAFKAGRTRYQTGEPCSRGHVAERFTSSGTCCKCQASDQAAKRFNLAALRGMSPA